MDTSLALNILSDHGYSVNNFLSADNDDEYEHEADDPFNDDGEDLDVGYGWSDSNSSSKLFRTEDEAIADCLSNIDKDDFSDSEVEEFGDYYDD